ncbi:MAG: hypothetical protein RL618_1051, partial [Pseudomonadota bacterium]
MKRLIDVSFSLLALVLLAPLG